MSNFSGKVVLITGAGRGAGKAIAEAFASQGARVAANDISPMNVEEVVEQINRQGGQAVAYVNDVAKKVAVQAMVNNVVDQWGKIDILINAANVEPSAPLLEMDEWDWHRTLDVNLTGAFLLMQSVGRVMREMGGGVMVNIAPIAGREKFNTRSAYVSSKIGLAGLTRQAAEEMREHGILIYAVCTGLPELVREAESHEDIATAVLHLCQPDGKALNGNILNIS